MLNIAYKTTRQWNPGDEFILLGVRRIFSYVFGPHNAIIYNCNPDVRPMESVKGARTWRLPLNYTENQQLAVADGYYRIGFMDNSIKFDSDLSYINYAVFAGTPEILSHRVLNFYEHIINFNLPCFVLGAGYWGDIDVNQKNVLKKAKILTFRTENLARQAQKDGFQALYLPCPSLCSCVKEKIISTPKTIGLVFSVGDTKSVPFAAVNETCAEYIKSLYPFLIKQFANKYKFAVICHYIDELSIANQIFSPLGVPIYYSYEATDYVDIYSQCDFVVSSRVHGCGIAASLGIPNINIAHDKRADTCKGFLSERIDCEVSKEDVLALLCRELSEVAANNQKLIQHKNSVFKEYIQLLRASDLTSPCYEPFVNTYLENKQIEKNIKKYFKTSSKSFNEKWRKILPFSGNRKHMFLLCLFSLFFKFLFLLV